MISVLVSVYKDENPIFLNQALTSIFDDQRLKPNQVVLVKDGALTSALDNVIAEWQNYLGNKLTVIALKENVGLGAALNEGLKHCEHEFVARMDSDDIALPQRFTKQIEFMNKYPSMSESSATIEEWDEELVIRQGLRRLPCEPKALLKFAKRRSPLSHPVTIFRKSHVLNVGGYPPLRKAQDYALWSLLLHSGYQLGNLPDVLLKMRTGKKLLDRRGWEYFKDEYKLLKFQKEIGFLSIREFVMNVMLKGIVRVAPRFIKVLAYKLLR